MLHAKDIHKVYNNGKAVLEVLKGVSLNIEKGRFIALVGPSGAGKSTLLNILGGLDNPTQGEVIFENADLYKLTDLTLSRIRSGKIGFVFQFYHLLSEFTVLENTLMPALISQSSRLQNQGLRKKAMGLLEKLGIIDRLEHFPNQLSGGEKQRVAIARALINDPQILFCDEPTGNLDSQNGNEIISLIKKINIENRMTIVLVTHNIELTKAADYVYHLKDGALIN
ncbi:MAG: ABC transporter ATP-binding protein [Candidatus Omnitrophota bacterium]